MKQHRPITTARKARSDTRYRSTLLWDRRPSYLRRATPPRNSIHPILRIIIDVRLAHTPTARLLQPERHTSPGVSDHRP